MKISISRSICKKLIQDCKYHQTSTKSFTDHIIYWFLINLNTHFFNLFLKVQNLIRFYRNLILR